MTNLLTGDLKYMLEMEALHRITEMLKSYDKSYSGLYSAVFYKKYFTGTTQEADQLLEEYGFFKVIRKIHAFESIKFGKVLTDFNDTPQVINTFFKILGLHFLWASQSFRQNYNALATLETNWQISEELNALLVKEVV